MPYLTRIAVTTIEFIITVVALEAIVTSILNGYVLFINIYFC
ncbi:MAG: hypothetical protein RM338_00420 [Nostoc sp. DedQUE12a]|nr:hypothetical protein [Nostoc sp. DedQUE12a]